MIALDIEYHAVIGQNTCRRIIRLDVLWRLPYSYLRFPIPGLQLLLHLTMDRPEFLERLFSDHPHSTKIRKVPKKGTAPPWPPSEGLCEGRRSAIPQRGTDQMKRHHRGHDRETGQKGKVNRAGDDHAVMVADHAAPTGCRWRNT